MTDRTLVKIEPLLVFMGGLLIFALGLFNREFIHLEARFDLFAQEMMRNGISFFPTAYHAPYPDYPATQTILVYLTSLVSGKVTIFSAVLPTAVAAAVTLSFTYLLGATHLRCWGLYAVLFELLTYQFLAAARSVAPDPFVAAATIICFYSAYTATRFNQPNRLLFVPLSLIVGFLFRGPIGLIIPAAVLCTFYLLEQDFKKLLQMVLLSVGLLSFALVGLLAAAWHEGGPAFVKEVIIAEGAGRIGVRHHPPFYSYFVHALHAFALSFPVAVLVAGIHGEEIIKSPTAPDLRFVRHLVAWPLVILIGMSIPTKQEMRYLVPIAPAISLLAAYLFVVEPKNVFARSLRRFIIIFCSLVPFLGLIVTVGCLGFEQMKGLQLGIHYPAAIVILGIVAATMIFTRKLFPEPAARELLIVACGATVFVAFNMFLVEPILVYVNRVTPFVEQVEARRLPDQAIVFYKIERDNADIKFMAALDKPILPEFVRSADEILSMNKPAIFITSQAEYDALPQWVTEKVRVLVTGDIARTHGVVFVVKQPSVSSPLLSP